MAAAGYRHSLCMSSTIYTEPLLTRATTIPFNWKHKMTALLLLFLSQFPSFCPRLVLVSLSNGLDNCFMLCFTWHLHKRYGSNGKLIFQLILFIPHGTREQLQWAEGGVRGGGRGGWFQPSLPKLSVRYLSQIQFYKLICFPFSLFQYMYSSYFQRFLFFINTVL